MASQTSPKKANFLIEVFRFRGLLIVWGSETSLGFRASVDNQNMRKYKVGDRLLVKLSGGRIVEATAKAVVDVVSGHAS